jgi:zinc transport system substrate-binding protein
MTLLRSTLLAAFALLVLSCGQAPDDVETAADRGPATARLSVYTVNYPLAYFAERIGGDLAEVSFPAPSDEDPAYWSPDAETIASYQGADLILLNGADYAKWVDRATLPASKMVNTSASFASRYIPLEGNVTHSHGPEGAHEHTGWAFNTWLDPTLAIEQARAVHEAFVAARPDAETKFGQGFAGLVAELSQLDQRLAAAADAIGDAPLLFSHPVYQYLEGRYNLDGTSVHWEPDQAPDLDELRHLLEHGGARWMVWEGDPLPETIASLESLGVRSVVFDPCTTRPEQGDFTTVMAANATSLEALAVDPGS